MAVFASTVLTYCAFGYTSLKAYHLCLAVLAGHYSAIGLLAYYVIVSALFLRRSKAKLETQDPWDWASAVVATWLPVHFNAAEPVADWISYVAGPMQLLGTAGMLFAISELSTSFGIVPANRGIKTQGAYQLVRHPLYLAELLTVSGFVLMNYSASNGMLLVILVSLQVQRIVNEERLLRQEAEYEGYCAHVPYRLVPHVF